MENLLAFVVFIVIAGISMAQKAREARKKAEEESRHLDELSRRPELREATRRVLYGEGGEAPRPAAPPPHTDLPEATRRILYGDRSEIPTARPRGVTAAPVRPVVVARPAAPPPAQDRVPRSPERPNSPPVRQPQGRPQPRPVGMPQRITPPVAPVRPAVPPRRMAPVPAASARTRQMDGGQDESAWAQTRREEREQRQAQARREVQARATRAADRRDHRLFAGGGALGRAMVLREVLGPPMALRGSAAQDPRNAPSYW